MERIIMVQSIMTDRNKKKLNLTPANQYRSIKDLKGILPKPNITLTCEEMDEIIKDLNI